MQSRDKKAAAPQRLEGSGAARKLIEALMIPRCAARRQASTESPEQREARKLLDEFGERLRQRLRARKQQQLRVEIIQTIRVGTNRDPLLRQALFILQSAEACRVGGQT